MVTVAKLLVPGSMSFLVLALSVGLVLSSGPRGMHRWGRRWLIALAALYVALSTPLVCSGLLGGLSRGYARLVDARNATGATAVVVVGNGVVTYGADGRALHQLTRRTAYCVLEAARLYKLLAEPWVIASGGIADSASQREPESDVMRAGLIELGVPAERILLESTSRNTREQVINVAALLRPRRFEHVVVVTSPASMWRTLALFEKLGLPAVPSVSSLRYGGPSGTLWRFVPSLDALRGSEAASYEYLAFLYYWLRGWV